MHISAHFVKAKPLKFTEDQHLVEEPLQIYLRDKAKVLIFPFTLLSVGEM